MDRGGAATAEPLVRPALMSDCPLSCCRSLKGPNLVYVGRQKEQGSENTLRRHSMDSAPARVVQGLVDGILDVAIEPFVGVAQGGIPACHSALL